MSWFVEHLHRDGSVLARVPVRGLQFTVGRSLDNDLILDDPHCAAHHARLTLLDDDRAELLDLGSINRIARQGGQPTGKLDVVNDQPIRIGQSIIRIRSSAWPLPPEQALSTRRPWVWALVGVALVLAHTAWRLWLSDTGEKSPPYLYGLSGMFLGLAVWSTAYALLGRLIGGVDRFFSHVLVASCGYLAGMLGNSALDLLAFATGWLWPAQIQQYVFIGIVALTVRAHLKLADPRHWHVTRWAVLLVAMGAMLVPLAQLWISSQRLTRIQVLENIEHPALRLASPSSVQQLSRSTAQLKAHADAARSTESGDDEFDSYDD